MKKRLFLYIYKIYLPGVGARSAILIGGPSGGGVSPAAIAPTQLGAACGKWLNLGMGMGNPPPPLIPLIGVPVDGYGAEDTSGSPLPALFVRVSPQNAAFAQGCVGVVAMLRCLGCC